MRTNNFSYHARLNATVSGLRQCLSAVAVLLVTGLPVGAIASTFANGTFEAPPLSSGGVANFYTSNGWSAQFPAIAAVYRNGAHAGVSAPEGVQYAGSRTGNYIYQDVAMTPGNYTVSLKARPQEAASPITIRVLRNGGQIGEFVASSSSWTLFTTDQFNIASSGTSTFRFEFIGATFKYGHIDDVKLNLLNSPPVVSLTSPEDNATVALGQSVVLAATASDSDGTILQVDFLVGGSPIHSSIASPYTHSWTPSSPGTYQVSARATDSNFAQTTSTARQVTVTAAGPSIHYIHTDHLGTPRMITRPSDNSVQWRWDNTEPFGSSPSNEDPSGLGMFGYRQRFPGQYFDSETGSHYNYFRDYDPKVGRYIQSDPIGLDGGINTFAYVDASPLNLYDFLGLVPGYGCRMAGGGEQLPSHLGCCSVVLICRLFVPFGQGEAAVGPVMLVVSCGGSGRQLGYDPSNGTTYTNFRFTNGRNNFSGLTDFRCPTPCK